MQGGLSSWLVVSVAALVIAVAVTPTYGAPDVNLSTRINDIYVKMGIATEARDFTWLGDVLTEGFVSIDVKGRNITRGETLKALREAFSAFDSIHTSFRVLNIKQADEGIEVSVAEHLDATFTDRDGASHRLVQDTESKDYWIDTGGLRIKKSVTSKSVIKVDDQAQE